MMVQAHIEFEKEFSERLTIHKNLEQEVVVTTVDKLTLCLMKNRDHLAAKHQWVTPLSLVLTLSTTLVAAEFKDFLLAKAVWQAIYILGAIACGVWLLRAAVGAWKNRKHGSVDGIVQELKATVVTSGSAA